MKKCDIAIVGAGAAGLTAARTARSLGKSVILIEKEKKLGGECLWTGCIPSKTLIKSASVAYHIRNMQEYGFSSTTRDLNTDMVMDHVRNTIQELYQKNTPEILASLGVEVIFGRAHLSDAHTVTINEETIYADKMLIATGASPIIPALEGLETIEYLTNQTLFNLKTIPQSMIILGGGTIGVELASALNRLGCIVSIIEMQSGIIPHEDAELVDILKKQMEDEGVRIRTRMKAVRVGKFQNGVMLRCVDSEEIGHEFEAEKLLVAVGRMPNVAGLGLEEAGVRITKRGIIADETMRTTAPTIYAAGDVAGPYQFSHMAHNQAIVAIYNACSSEKKRSTYDNCLWVTFTAPELATLGLTEQAAREHYGDTIVIYRKSYDCIDRAYSDNTRQGIAKVICDRQGYILGAHILGERAGEIIHELALAKYAGKPFQCVESMVHAYPTYSDILWHMNRRAGDKAPEENIWAKLYKKLFS